MAEKYGFEYELVQYKWPRWLHAQTEKQRIIWGYVVIKKMSHKETLTMRNIFFVTFSLLLFS